MHHDHGGWPRLDENNQHFKIKCKVFVNEMEWYKAYLRNLVGQRGTYLKENWEPNPRSG